jgi:hypothetical protein
MSDAPTITRVRRTAQETVRALLRLKRPEGWHTWLPEMRSWAPWSVYVGGVEYARLSRGPRSGRWTWHYFGRGNPGYTTADSRGEALDEIADNIARRLHRGAFMCPWCPVCGLPMVGLTDPPGGSVCVDLEGGRDYVSFRIPGCGFERR